MFRLLRADEKWLPVYGYETIYLVSDCGRVRNITTGRILKATTTKTGYRRVTLYNGIERKSFLVHRLVAMAFIGVPNDPELQINHLDGDKSNNRIDNLEWCTQSENLAHSFKIGLRNYNLQQLLNKNRKRVRQLDMKGEPIREWESMSEAARQLGLSVSNICNCCAGRLNSTGGYRWEICLDY